MKTTKKALAAMVALTGLGALAAGFGLYEMDAGSTAMGGHVFGSPRNASAVYYNPAGMSGMTGTVFTVGMTVINPRADARVNMAHDTRMNAGWIFAPTFFVTQELPWGFHFGFGGFADFGIASSYNNHWELKHDSTKTMLEGYTLQPVLSYDILDNWSVAAGPRFTFVNFETRQRRDFGFADKLSLAQSMALYGVPVHAAARGRNRLKIQADNEDDIGVGLVVGTQYRLTDKFALGAMYRSRVKTTLKGHASWKGDDFSHHGNDLSETIQLPAQITLGFNWDDALWLDDLHLGASVSWIEWSKMSALRFDVYNPISKKVENNEIKMDWRNTYRAGFGLGYDVTDNWEVMAGYTYDWDPCRNRLGYDHTMLPMGDRHIVTSGLAWTSDDGVWEIAFSYALVIQESRSQRIPDEYYAYNKKVHKMHVHNGYSHIFSFGVTYRF